jgi:hypothetical protein
MRARPKSTILAILSVVMMMFDGLTSRCTMFRAGAARNPLAIWIVNCSDSRAGTAPRESFWARVSPS